MSSPVESAPQNPTGGGKWERANKRSCLAHQSPRGALETVYAQTLRAERAGYPAARYGGVLWA
eukprot:9488728-Pyramimonas_sp.AAC.1